jgi:enoyl-CoA hydratase
MATEAVTYVLEDKVAIVTMDDGKANALSQTMIEALLAAHARAEREANAMVLAGRPERFCAGFDLRVMMSGPEAATTLLKSGSNLLMKFYGSPIPLVIACTGHAVAGGALLALTGDYRIGAQGPFKMGLNELSIGLPVPVLAMELARDRLSRRALVQATLLATLYEPEAAVAAGYLDLVVPADQVVDRARAEATKLATLPRVPFVQTKQRLRGATIQHVISSLDADMRDIMKPSNA